MRLASTRTIYNYSGNPPEMENVSVEDIIKKRIVKAGLSATIKDVAKLMCESGSTYVLLGDEEVKGIITEGDMKRAIAQGMDTSSKASSIANENIIKIEKNMGVEEAGIEFFKNKIKHLPVEDNGKIIGVLTIKDMAFFLSKSPLYFLKEFSKAKSIDEIKKSYQRFQRYVLEILPREFDSGSVDPGYIGKMISMINDEILISVIRICIENLGKPKCKFSFFVMGSEGRMEQLLRTDQDNAMIFEKKQERDYFLELGKSIHSSLLKIGFSDCPEGYTVGNNTWVMSLEDWSEKMEHWAFSLEAKDLLNLSVFGDMRHVYGEKELFDKLRERLFTLCRNERVFANLLDVSLGFSVPSKPKEMDIKNQGLLPLIAPIRILSLKFDIKNTNTIDRIGELCTKEDISNELASNLKVAYNLLKTIHFLTQIENIKRKEKDVNRLNLKDIPKIKAKFLKDSLKTISEFQGPMREKLRWLTSGFV